MENKVEKPLIYLACPYFDPDPVVRNKRYNCATEVAVKLMENGLNVFSPLSHSIPIDRLLTIKENKRHDFWMEQDLKILKKCDLLLVLNINGLDNSRGVREEIEAAIENKIPYHYIQPWDISYKKLAEKINNYNPKYLDFSKCKIIKFWE
jgi:hypothetical protein